MLLPLVGRRLRPATSRHHDEGTMVTSSVPGFFHEFSTAICHLISATPAIRAASLMGALCFDMPCFIMPPARYIESRVGGRVIGNSCQNTSPRMPSHGAGRRKAMIQDIGPRSDYAMNRWPSGWASRASISCHYALHAPCAGDDRSYMMMRYALHECPRKHFSHARRELAESLSSRHVRRGDARHAAYRASSAFVTGGRFTSLCRLLAATSR